MRRRRGNCRFAPAGFERGPSRLKIVRVPSSTRVGPTWRIAELVQLREHEAKPGFIDAGGWISSGPMSSFTPRAERASAVPGFRAERLVAMLCYRKACACNDDRGESRDVIGAKDHRRLFPTISTACSGADTGSMRARIEETAPTISSTVSPRTRSAIRNRRSGTAWPRPDIRMSKAWRASSRFRLSPFATLAISGFSSACSPSPGLSVCGHRLVCEGLVDADTIVVLKDV